MTTQKTNRAKLLILCSASVYKPCKYRLGSKTCAFARKVGTVKICTSTEALKDAVTIVYMEKVDE